MQLKKRFLCALISVIAVLSLQIACLYAQDQGEVKPPPGVQTAPAKTTAAAAHQAKPQDFSQGFKRFYSLGLPDVKGATYVKLDRYNDHSGMMMDHEMKLAGSAWMLPAVASTNAATDPLEASKRTFVLSNGRKVDIYDDKELSKAREKKMKEMMKEAEGKKKSRRQMMYLGMNELDGKSGGRWKEVNPAKDITAILDYLAKQKEKAEAESNRRRHYSSSVQPGSVFLSAVFFHRQGYTNEANKIVQALFDLSSDRKQVVMGAMNSLGDTKYDEVYERFTKTGDWKQYAGDMDKLAGQFAAGWRALPAMQKITEAVKKHIASPTPPAPAGEGITAEDIALAKELSEAPPASRSMPYDYMFSSGELWILGSASRGRFQPPQGTNVISKITARGMKSVPLLLALVKETSLTRVNLKGSSHYYYSSYFDEDVSEADIQRMYENMQRPSSMSEIAMTLLKNLPPSEEDRSYSDKEIDPDEFQQEVGKWYAETKSFSPSQLARYYIEKGNENQRNSALTFLVEKGTEADFPEIERLILEKAKEPNGPNSTLHLASQYVDRRGPDAKAFVDKFELAVRNPAAPASSEDDPVRGSFVMGGGDDNKEYIDQQLSQLKQMISAKPLEELLAELNTDKGEDVMQSLYSRISKEKPDKALGILLEAALKAQKPAVAAQLLHYCAYATSPDMDESEEATGQPSIEVTPTMHAALWEKLLADTRIIQSDEDDYDGSDTKTTVAQTAAGVMEIMFSEDIDARGSAYALGDAATSLMETRARERLAGKKENELTPFPSADGIDDKRRKELATALSAAQTGSAEAFIAGLKPAEQLALLEEAEDRPEITKTTLGEAHRITKVVDAKGQPSARKECQSLVGQKLSRQTVETMLDLVKKVTADGPTSRCNIRRESRLRGVTVVYSEKPTEPGKTSDPMMRMRMGMGSRPGRPNVEEASATGSVSAPPDCSASTRWLVTATAPAAKPAEASTGEKDADDMLESMMDEMREQRAEQDQESQKEFWEAVDRFVAGEGNLLDDAAIRISGSPVPPPPQSTNTVKTTTEAETGK